MDNDDESDLSYHEYDDNDDEDETISIDDRLKEVPSWSNPSPNLPSRSKSEADKSKASQPRPSPSNLPSSPPPSRTSRAGLKA